MRLDSSCQWLHVMRELGMRWNPYDYEGNLFHTPDADELDPVPPRLPACINSNACVSAAALLECAPLIRAARAGNTLKGFEEELQPDAARRPDLIQKDGSLLKSIGRSTTESFLPCLLLIMSWNLLMENTEHAELICLATFFTVAKSSGMSRAIFDCRLFNGICRIPPPVNLPSISDIMRLAAELGITHVLSSDFKHYFFQLGLPKGAEKYFGLRCQDRSGPVAVVRYFFSNVWAMGASFSPFQAQAHSMICILKKPAPAPHGHPPVSTLGIDYAEIAALTQLPPFVYLYDSSGATVGFIVCMYDNIGVFCKDSTMAQAWKKRLLSNAKDLNFWWKEMHMASPDKPVFHVDTWNARLHGGHSGAIRPVPKPESPEDKKKRLSTLLITFLGVEIGGFVDRAPCGHRRAACADFTVQHFECGSGR